MSVNCGMCSQNVASVFRPSVALCKPCFRSLLRDEIRDYAIDNQPTCPRCGEVLSLNARYCPECWRTDLVAAHRRMVRVG